MIPPLTDRSGIDAALADFVAALRDGGLDERAEAVERASSDVARAQALGTCMSGVRPEGRIAFLYRASVSLHGAYAALATAAREQQRVVAALEAYRRPGGPREVAR